VMGDGRQRSRVVITGIGMVTPLGLDVESTWEGLRLGRSAISRIRLFDASTYPTAIAAQVPTYDLADHVPELASRDYVGRNECFALTAAAEAYRDSGLPRPSPNPRRTGVYLGSGEGAMDFFKFAALVINNWKGDHVDVAAFLANGLRQLNAVAELEQEPNMPAGYVAEFVGAQGYNSNCLTACAASSQALGEAGEVIRRGDAEVMVTGGCHSMIHPLGMAGFNLLTALARLHQCSRDLYRGKRPRGDQSGQGRLRRPGPPHSAQFHQVDDGSLDRGRRRCRSHHLLAGHP